jgi:hypothetical protein
MNKYPNSGALFYSQNRVHPNSPDLTGDISIDRSLLRQMLDETDEDSIKIRMSGWEKQGARGPFFSLKVNTYKKPDAPKGETTPLTVGQNGEIDDRDIPF